MTRLSVEHSCYEYTLLLRPSYSLQEPIHSVHCMEDNTLSTAIPPVSLCSSPGGTIPCQLIYAVFT